MWAMGDGCDNSLPGRDHETRDVVLNDASRVVSGSSTTKYFGGDDIGRGISMISADDRCRFICWLFAD